jgi:hypothetical protein
VMSIMKESQWLLHNPLVRLGDFLEDFVSTQDLTATIKDETGRYCVCNSAISRRSGIPLEDYIGLNVHDIGEIMHYKDSVIKHAVDIDNRIYKGVIPYARYKQAMPVHNGFIAIERVIKRPILSKSNQVIAILGYGYDVTADVDLIQLFKLYQQYYPMKEAIQYLLRYLKIYHVFYNLPTKRELEVLLTMRKTASAKYVAKELNLSPKTIDENKARLRSHLKKITLDELLMRLRTRNELQGSIE